MTDRPPIPFSEWRLDNGLRLVVHEDRSDPVVAVHLMVHVGSRHEPPGKTGFAHLFEHLLFQGSEHVPNGAHFVHVQDAGGTLNGSTWFDRTNYFEIVPSNALDLALWLESDRLGWFLPGLTEETFETQRSVVMNERRQRYENQPYGLWLETLLELLFPPGHPCRHPTIGSMADLEAATLEDARAFFRTWYRPGNAALVLAGDVGTDEAIERVEAWFGEIPAAEVPEPRAVPAVTLAEERRETVVEPVELPRLYVGWHAPPWGTGEAAALDLGGLVLAGGRASRLHRRLVYEERIAQNVTVVNWPRLERAGIALAIVTGKPGASNDALLEGLDREIARLAADGPTADELDRARAQALVGHGLEVEDVGGRADLLAHAAVLLDDPAFAARRLDLWETAGAEAVRDAVAARLADAGRAVVAYEPENGAGG